MAKKNDIKTNEAVIAMNETEVRALMIIVERYIINSDKLKDIKGLCTLHSKLEDSLTAFIPF